MKAHVGLFVLVAAVVHPTLAAPASPEIDCMGVKIDALSGARYARSGSSLEKGLADLAASYRDIDVKLIKMKRKPSSLAMKTQGKMSFADGYREALRQPDKTADTIAGEAFLECEFAKVR